VPEVGVVEPLAKMQVVERAVQVGVAQALLALLMVETETLTKEVVAEVLAIIPAVVLAVQAWSSLKCQIP